MKAKWVVLGWLEGQERGGGVAGEGSGRGNV